jgi:hypothetical protein
MDNKRSYAMNKKQNTNLIIDVLLFAGFLLAFFLDLTGLILHEWLGIIICAIAGIHLLLHDAWVKNALRRFSELPNRPLILFLIDAAIAIGFLGILATGLMISTWLNLALADYSPWVTLHTIFAIETLFVLIIKIGFHWRWISACFRSRSLRTVAASAGGSVPAVASSFLNTVSPTQAKIMSRRDFLAVMGVTGVAAWLAVANVLKQDQNAASATTSSASEPTATESSIALVENSSTTATPPSSTPTATQQASQPTQVIVQQPTTSTCSVRCNHRCSFPGHCGRYYDSNNNGLCDNGECM